MAQQGKSLRRDDACLECNMQKGAKDAFFHSKNHPSSCNFMLINSRISSPTHHFFAVPTQNPKLPTASNHLLPSTTHSIIINKIYSLSTSFFLAPSCPHLPVLRPRLSAASGCLFIILSNIRRNESEIIAFGYR